MKRVGLSCADTGNTRCSWIKIQPYKIWEFSIDFNVADERSGGGAVWLIFAGWRRECPIRPTGSRITEPDSISDTRQNASHAHTDRQTVKTVHQTDGEGQIADFTRAKVIEQRQVNIIFSVGLSNVRHRFRPG